MSKGVGRFRGWSLRDRNETLAAFVVRAISSEVSRCEAKMSVADRIAAGDLAEIEVLALLTEEEKKEYGL